MGKRKTAIGGQLADMDLRLLRVFKAVADSGGFTAAEIELNLANSTICNYIADLEKRLDMRLCERGHPLHGREPGSIRLDELQQYRFVESPRLQPGRELHPVMVGWNKQVSAHHQEARATLILTGHYLGFLPHHLVNNWGWGNELQPVLEQELGYSNTFYAITKHHADRNLVVDTFFSGLREAMETDVHQETRRVTG